MFFPYYHRTEIELNDFQRCAINSIIFSDNFCVVSSDSDGNIIVGANIDDDVLMRGLKTLCQRKPELIDDLTDLVIDLHTKDKPTR